MTTRHILSNVTRFALVAAIGLSTASCGSELLRTGRSPAFLVLTGLQARPGGGTEVTDNLLSDVATSTGTVFNDLGVATFRAELKEQVRQLTGTEAPTTPIQNITLTRYRVSFRRSDGRNTPGVDVPWGFDGAVTATVPIESERIVIFDLVRHANKVEPPLRNLRGIGGQAIISTVAEITFFGRDQNGNEVTITGLMDVTFGDFPDAT